MTNLGGTRNNKDFLRHDGDSSREQICGKNQNDGQKSLFFKKIIKNVIIFAKKY